MSYFAYSVTGPLELFEVRSKTSEKVLTYRVLFLSPDLEAKLPFSEHPRLRISGEIEDIPVHLAWVPSGTRGHYALVSPAICKALALRPGSEVTLRFNLAPQDEVILPEELERALAGSAKRRKLWAALTPGRKRGLAHVVSSAKAVETRMRRVETVFDELERGVVVRTGPKRSGAPQRPRTRRG